MSRHIAREIAFKIIFEYSFQDEDAEELFEKYLESHSEDFKSASEEDLAYIKDVISGVKKNLNSIDEKIKTKLKDWNIERINKVDISVLRLSIYEILYKKDIPEKVSVNEAVEICKMYGEENSKSFVNGVLAKVLEENSERPTNI